MQRDMLQITNMGRVDESNAITASQLTFTLKNGDGRFTPRNAAGAYYPNIIRNTPVRVSVNATSTSSVTYSGYRYHGEVSSWPPTSDISQHDVYAHVIASGIWRRISQTPTTIGSAYSRYAAQQTGVNVPAGAWTMEDGSGSLVFAAQAGAGGAATFTGTPSFAQDGTSFPGADALPQFNQARITANVSSGATPSNVVVRFALAVPAGGDSTTTTFAQGGELANILMPSGTGIKRVSVSLNQNSTLQIQGWAATTGGAALWTGVIATKVAGTPVLVSAELTPSGGSVNWALRIIKPGGAAALDQVTGTRAASVLAAVTQVTLNIQGRLGNTTFGQLGVFYAVPSLVTAAAALGGFSGEFAVARFQRLCAESGIATEVIGSTSAAMGPQVDDTLSNLLQVIENTDGGLLYETTDQFGLGYRTLISMQNQSPAVTLNYAAGTLGAPLAATYDDQLLKNRWTVTNWDGYTAVATLTSGALSVQPVPNGAGLYAGGPMNVSASTHAQVDAIAKQQLFLGTVDDVRYPQVTADLRRGQVASLFATVPSLRIGDYLQVTSLPAFDGGGTAKQLAWGWTETLNAFTWSQVFNTVPELPFETSFSPGAWSVVQAPSGSVAAGSQVGSSVSGAQFGAGAIPGLAPGATLSARGIGGVGSFIAATAPYDWSFAVSGTPADTTYFTCTDVQAVPISAGDTFTNSGGLGGPFTVTALAPPAGGNVSVYFTPDATSVMSTGTVYGGKNGDTWVNTSAGNQIEQWQAGAWVPVQFGPAALSFTAGGVKVTFAASAPGSPATGDLWYDTSNGNKLNQWNGSSWVAFLFGTSAIAANSITAALIAANTITAGQIAAGAITTATIAAQAVTAAKIAASTITASQIAAGTILAANLAAGIVVAGIVDATAIQAAQYTATGTQGEFLAYSGTPAAGNLIASTSGASSGTDAFGNSYMSGITSYDPATGKITQLHTGALSVYQSASQAGLAGGVYANPTYAGQATLISGQSSGGNQAFLVAYSQDNTNPLRIINGGAPEINIAGFIYIDSWHAITMDTGWSTISGYSVPQYRFGPDGCLQLAGGAQLAATTTTSTNLNGSSQLPVAYRPNANRSPRGYSVIGGWGAVQVDSGGVITMQVNAGNPSRYCILDNITVKLN